MGFAFLAAFLDLDLLCGIVWNRVPWRISRILRLQVLSKVRERQWRIIVFFFRRRRIVWIFEHILEWQYLFLILWRFLLTGYRWWLVDVWEGHVLLCDIRWRIDWDIAILPCVSIVADAFPIHASTVFTTCVVSIYTERRWCWWDCGCWRWCRWCTRWWCCGDHVLTMVTLPA